MAETIGNIKKKLETATGNEREELIKIYSCDERQGVQKLIEKYQKEQTKLQAEIARIEGMKEFEYKYSQYSYICGIDEVGRGPLVGPVVTACVILPENYTLDGLTDSKKLSIKKREMYFDIIMKDALSISIGIKDEKVIDDINIYEATKLAMLEAINNSKIKPEHVLIDAMKLEDLTIPSTSIIKGDLKSITIAAASVIAKVTRDRMLIELDKKYPEYGFAKNAGYGTKQHIEAIEKYGIIDEHRKTFKPVSEHLNHFYKK